MIGEQAGLSRWRAIEPRKFKFGVVDTGGQGLEKIWTSGPVQVCDVRFKWWVRVTMPLRLWWGNLWHRLGEKK